MGRPARRGGTSTSQGHARTVFKRALEQDNLLVAEATVREIGHVTLAEALDLTALIARKAPRRHPRAAARWLLRYLEENSAATIEEAGVVATCLAALGSPGHEEAAVTLRAMAERATGRRARATSDSRTLNAAAEQLRMLVAEAVIGVCDPHVSVGQAHAE